MIRNTLVPWSSIGLALVLVAGCTIEGTPDPVDERDPFVPEAPPAAYVPPQPVAKARRLVILHTNDEHSHLLGFAPNNEYPFLPDETGNVDPVAVATKLASDPDSTTVGGLVRRQYLINTLRAESDDPTLLVSAGDVMMGTIFHAATGTAAPDYLAMALLGYDFVTLGNHEFDFGPDTLSSSIRTVNNTAFGGAVPIVISNIHFDTDSAQGADLESMYGPGNSGAPLMRWATKTMANGLTVGILGIVGYDASLVAPVKGRVAFSVPEGESCDEDPCAAGLVCVRQRCVDPLDAAGHLQALAAEVAAAKAEMEAAVPVDLVVLLSHSGSQEEAFVAQHVDGIDVLVGGHSHEAIEPFVIPGTDTIYAQAGSYGRYLGKITVEVAPDGSVSLVEPDSELLPVDHTLDEQILADTDLEEGIFSAELQRALQLTGAVIGPVVQGLNAQLAPALGVPSILAPVAASDHDVEGEREGEDHPLFHLVTDSVRTIVGQGACLPTQPRGRYAIAVQASGVIRESLRFSKSDPPNNTTTFADVFRVLPLGGSPFEGDLQIPGYPVVMFNLSGPSLYAGIDIGATQGLESTSFFLSYAGMRVTYDTTLPPVDPAELALLDPSSGVDPLEVDPGGRVTLIEVDSDFNGDFDTVIYDYGDGMLPWVARWSNFNLATDQVTVLTNLYLAGFLDAFGLQPLTTPESATGAGVPYPSSDAFLASSALCTNGAAGGCGADDPQIVPCIEANGGLPPWGAGVVEVKEWGTLLSYLTNPMALNGVIPPGMYDADTFAARVVDATPE